MRSTSTYPIRATLQRALWNSRIALIDRAAFPFVVGCGRSGTTLLRAMLDSHPDMAIPPESYFIPEIAAGSADDETFARETFSARLAAHDRFLRWELPIDLVEDALEEGRICSYADAIRCTFACYASMRQKVRYGDKTPRYVREITLLAELFPEARFIHVIRDGRDVASSFLEMRWGPKTIEEAARRWRKLVSAGRRAGSVLPPDRYLEVHYEALVEDSARALSEVCGFIDLPSDPAMLQYPSRFADIVAGTKYPDQHAHVELPPTRGLRDWRRDMTRSDVAAFESVAGALLEESGYERATPEGRTASIQRVPDPGGAVPKLSPQTDKVTGR